MKKGLFEKYALWLVVLWFVLIGFIAVMFTSCSVREDDWSKTVVRIHVDSVETIQPASTLEFEPKYKMYLANGHHIIVRSRSYAYNTDSIEVVYMNKIK